MGKIEPLMLAQTKSLFTMYFSSLIFQRLIFIQRLFYDISIQKKLTVHFLKHVHDLQIGTDLP